MFRMGTKMNKQEALDEIAYQLKRIADRLEKAYEIGGK